MAMVKKKYRSEYVDCNRIEMNLLDLPDEILFFILKKLNVVDTLFRQSGLHNRLDQLLFDGFYVRQLDFTIKSSNKSISPMDNSIIDRVCEDILPYINDKIIELIVEPNASERVLCAVDYPKVSSLSLIDFPKNILIQYLTKNPSRIEQFLTKQITHLNVHLIDETTNDDNPFNLFELILSLSKYLIQMTFHQSIQFEDRNLTISQFSSTICFSLRQLDIHLNTFEECLFIFDGRFPSLFYCSIYIHKIFVTSSSIDNRVIDYLSSIINENNYPSNDDLQQSFLDNLFGPVRSYIHPSRSKTVFRCHIYSLPFQFKTFLRLTCLFPCDTFISVRILSINDSISWNYHLFSKVNQYFPFLETLMICNSLPQQNNKSEQFPIVTFNRLFELDLSLLHMDYVEQLIKLTNDFTKDSTVYK